MITTKIVADSIAPSGIRLTTFVLTYPRFAHSEVMTHRVFSRNASSSRAIPVKKQIQDVIDNPAIPIAFTKNQKGMQGGEILSGIAHDAAVATWMQARDEAVKMAQQLYDINVHKQYVNRILEPFAHITVVLSGTEFTNWFALRYHEMALPEMQELAKQMWELYSTNKPEELSTGSWHLPFISEEDTMNTLHELGTINSTEEWDNALIKRSVAKCARVSYLNHDGTKTSLKQDLELYDRLLGSSPVHASPAEHQAMAIGDSNVKSGNFSGWIQYRQTIKGQNVESFRGYK
jgi:thymidylate synthase ThyX